ncbi:IS66 family transposase [Atopobium sp. oral taxon 810]|uniref:IS66 family transposase n=1 Tax=Atopobium sp. oral taxon 810 TaxID=712158 RepID=UPI0003978405|nr:IS66 family transposase [Atopobium sp. oral taxon 810]ERI05109.1 IS66 family element, transposase [Atopobium sp. oral taxon 810 str. F0209]
MDKIRLVPVHFEVIEHHRHVYSCKSCSQTNAKDGTLPVSIMRAPMPTPPIPGSFVHPSLIVYVLHGKFVNAMPLYRIEQDMATAGLEISRQDMSNWVLNIWRCWLTKIHARMKTHLLSYDYIHADETVVQVLKEPGKAPQSQSRMWLFCAPARVAPNYIFEYRPTRSGQVVRNFLGSWSGYLTTDGHQPYFRLGPQVTNTACLVHLRRKFDEVVKSAGSDSLARKACSIALKGRQLIDAIFKADEAFNGMTSGDVQKPNATKS